MNLFLIGSTVSDLILRDDSFNAARACVKQMRDDVHFPRARTHKEYMQLLEPIIAALLLTIRQKLSNGINKEIMDMLLPQLEEGEKLYLIGSIIPYSLMEVFDQVHPHTSHDLDFISTLESDELISQKISLGRVEKSSLGAPRFYPFAGSDFHVDIWSMYRPDYYALKNTWELYQMYRTTGFSAPFPDSFVECLGLEHPTIKTVIGNFLFNINKGAVEIDSNGGYTYHDLGAIEGIARQVLMVSNIYMTPRWKNEVRAAVIRSRFPGYTWHTSNSFFFDGSSLDVWDEKTLPYILYKLGARDTEIEAIIAQLSDEYALKYWPGANQGILHEI